MFHEILYSAQATYLVCGDSIMTRVGRETFETDGAKYGASVSSNKRESGTRLATSWM